MRRNTISAGVLALALVLLVGCGNSAQVGRTGSGVTTPGPAPTGASPADTPGLTGSAQTPDPGRAPTILTGETPDPAAGGTGGVGSPVVPLGLDGLQLLGVPVTAFGPDVVGAEPGTPDPSAGPGDAPVISPVEQALQILGVPVLAFPPDSFPPAPAPAGTGTGTGTDPGTGTPAGGLGTGTGAGTQPGGSTNSGSNNSGSNNTGSNNSSNNNSGGNNSSGGSQAPIPTSTDFCGDAHDLSNALNAVTNAGGPSALESAVNWARRSFGSARSSAPSALQHDVEVLDSAFGKLFDGMEAVGYDRNKVSPGSFSELATDDARTAQNRFNQYVADVC